MIYIGIDPGVSGGIAILYDGPTIETHKLADRTDAEIMDLLGPLGTYDPGQVKAVIEKVGATPQMGVVSAFTFGRGIGRLHMALAAACIPFDQVAPSKWQQTLDCRSGGDKNITKRRAQQLFPSLTITHAIADALLIAEYCRRVERGSIQRTRQEQIDGKEGEGFTGEDVVRWSTLSEGRKEAVAKGSREGAPQRPRAEAAEGRHAAGHGRPQGSPALRTGLRRR